jgi:thioredoxin-related protein
MKRIEIYHRLAGVLQSIAYGVVIATWAFGALRAETFDDSRVMHIEYPGWFEETPFLDLARVTSEARSLGKQGLMVLFTTEGCSYCAEFIRRSLGDPEIASMTREHFLAVGLEIFTDAEMTDPTGREMPVKAFADEQGAEFSPTLVFFGSQGEELLRVVGYRSPEQFRAILGYLGGGHYRTEPLRAYMAKRAKEASESDGDAGLRDDPLFGDPPYALDRSRFAAPKPLLVIFEAKGCAACENLHEQVLARADVRDSLGSFEVVRLDAADEATPVLAPDGTRTNPSTWFERLGLSRLPALVFFDEKGNRVLTTDALVLRQRMMNSLHYVLERAYEKGWTYQRFARSKGFERHRQNQ